MQGPLLSRQLVNFAPPALPTVSIPELLAIDPPTVASYVEATPTARRSPASSGQGGRVSLKTTPRRSATLERAGAIAVGLPPLPRLGRSWRASTPAPFDVQAGV